jgi:hypothetical protein
MTKTIWQKNWAGCARSFKNAIDTKQIDANWANEMCDCVTDELVNKISCDDMKKYDSDQKFQLEESNRITGTCKKKVPLKRID